MVKGAAFSMIGEDLAGYRFLDLCAGSGQMGLEACSRGATVTLNEPDGKRRAFIEEQVQHLKAGDGVTVYGRLAELLVRALAGKGEVFDFIYVDPPYDAVMDELPLSTALLSVLGTTDLVSDRGAVVIQHGKRTTLPESSGCLQVFRKKKYGDTRLSVFIPARY
jgi:16S rRNA (guanine(966)-N(2))-methyltransferase RsmD